MLLNSFCFTGFLYRYLIDMYTDIYFELSLMVFIWTANTNCSGKGNSEKGGAGLVAGAGQLQDRIQSVSGSGDLLLLICNLLRQIHFVRTDVSINSFLPGLCSLNWKLIAGHRAVLVEVEVVSCRSPVTGRAHSVQRHCLGSHWPVATAWLGWVQGEDLCNGPLPAPPPPPRLTCTGVFKTYRSLTFLNFL